MWNQTRSLPGARVGVALVVSLLVACGGEGASPGPDADTTPDPDTSGGDVANDTPSDDTADTADATDTSGDGTDPGEDADTDDAANADDADAGGDATDTEDASVDASDAADTAADTASAATDATPDAGDDWCALYGCAELYRECLTDGTEGGTSCEACVDGYVDIRGECVPETACADVSECPEPPEGRFFPCLPIEDCGVDLYRWRPTYVYACVENICQLGDGPDETEFCETVDSSDGDFCGADGTCEGGTCYEVPPAAPTGVVATDGASAAHVEVDWDAVEGATGYRVLRDGVDAGTVATPPFLDTAASAGTIGLVGTLTAESPEAGVVSLAWTEPESFAGLTHTYTVVATNIVGDSDASAGDPGFRAAPAIVGYVVTATDTGDTYDVAGTTWDDPAPLLALLSVGTVTASNGTRTDGVALELSGQSALPAPTLSYSVGVRTSSGVGAAAAVTGQVTVGPRSIAWLRSASTADADFAELPGLFGINAFDDTAPANGEQRYYRARVSALGAQTTDSASDAGFRLPLSPPGAICSTGTTCSTGMCVDGVCCSSACTGTCERCNIAGSLGTCTAVAAGMDPDNECVAQLATTCGQTGMCSGSRTCQLFAAGAACDSPFCTSETTGFAAPLCDGAGTCGEYVAVDCGAYDCNSATGACRTRCANADECAPDYTCGAFGTCLGLPGASCRVAGDCASGTCIRGACT
jgi:hypothetical protein